MENRILWANTCYKAKINALEQLSRRKNRINILLDNFCSEVLEYTAYGLLDLLLCLQFFLGDARSALPMIKFNTNLSF